ncbi:MAG: hypothetical protein JAY90_20035 [Candidatus Thiodiazotropha lotti]|nr:hypothetical protein [Candidatus Thiodiazotropha lotti]
MSEDSELYVLTAERDTYEPRNDSRSIVFEQCLDHGTGTLESVKAFQKRLDDRFGKTRIAKLVFLDE